MSTSEQPHHPVFQCRPGTPGGMPDPKARLYAPQRDLAYIFPEAAKEAFESLDECNWMGYYAGLLREKQITQQMLAEGVRLFVEAFHFFVGDPTIKSIDDALERTGFLTEVPALVRMIIFERLGEVCTAGFFIAMRDVSRVGQEPPQTEALAGFEAAAKAFVRRLVGDNGQQASPSDYTLLRNQITALSAELAYVRVSLKSQQRLTEDANQKWQAASRVCEKREFELQQALKREQARAAADLAELEAIPPPSAFTLWWRAWFKRK